MYSFYENQPLRNLTSLTVDKLDGDKSVVIIVSVYNVTTYNKALYIHCTANIQPLLVCNCFSIQLLQVRQVLD